MSARDALASSTWARRLRHEVDAAYDEMVDLRRQLHATPELSFAETLTTTRIRQHLSDLGLVEEPCPTETGAVFRLPAGRRQVEDGPILLRADIDALPVHEESRVPFASATPGVMHACGHDAHAAILVGTARVLATMVDDLARDVIFVFQPGEEAISGATAMVAGGLLAQHRPSKVLGCHVTSLAPAGLVLSRPGVAMAGVDTLRAVIRGKGGHGAIDPRRGNVVLAAARLAVDLESVVEDLSYQGTGCVCSPGVLGAGTAPNVIPVKAEVLGTLRTFSQAQAQEAWVRLEELAQRTAAEFEVEVMLDPPFRVGPVRNDPSVTASLEASARRVLPEGALVEMPAPASASDDVSVFLDQVPGSYFFVGAALPDGSSGIHHSPTFAIDEGSLRTGAVVMTAAAADLASHG